MILIGLGYKAAAGKDEVADYLCKKYGFVKTAFAKNLKDCCTQVFSISYDQVYSPDKKQERFGVPIKFTSRHYENILDWMRSSVGYEIVRDPVFFSQQKNTKLYTPRDTLQFVGTEVMRHHEKDYHVMSCMKFVSGNIKERNVVVSDVRFINEAQAILDSSGVCIKVVRGVTHSGEYNKLHKSEVELDGWDGWSFVLDNTLEGLNNLHANIDNLMEKLL